MYPGSGPLSSARSSYPSRNAGGLSDIPQPSMINDDSNLVLPPLRNVRKFERDDRSSEVSAEHERTRQERLKLERYKVKRDMLRELLQAGVPASQIPQLFAEMDMESGSSSKLAPETSRDAVSSASSSPMASTSPMVGVSPMMNGWNQPGHAGQQFYPSPRSTPVLDPGPRSSHIRTPSMNPSPVHDGNSAADGFATSPRALQFKFYNPGPKQKVLRRRGNNVGGGKSTPPQNGVRKNRNRALSRSAGSASPKATGSTTAGKRSQDKRASPDDNNAIMSDGDDDSDEDDESGSDDG